MAGFVGVGLLALCVLPGCGVAESGDSEAGATVTESGVQAALDAAEKHVHAERYDEAIIILQTLVQRMPDHAEGRQFLGDVLFRVSETLLEQGNRSEATALRQEAAEHYEHAASTAPHHAPLRQAAGLMHMSAGNEDEALRSFRLAADLDRTNPQYPLFAAQIHMKRDQWDQAADLVDRSLTLDAHLPHGWASLAIIRMEQARFDDAIECIERARELAPGDHGLRAQHARILRRAGHAERALQLLLPLNADVQIEPSIAEEMSRAFLALLQPQRAAEVWSRAMQRHHTARLNWSMAHDLASSLADQQLRREALHWVAVCRAAQPPAEFTERIDELERRIRTFADQDP